MAKKTFTPIPDEWAHKDFTLTMRYIVASILRYQDNGKEYFVKRTTFCQDNGIGTKAYDGAIQKLRDLHIIVEVRKLAKNITVWKVDKTELEFFLRSAKRSQSLCQKVTTTSAKRSQVQVPKGHHSIIKEDIKQNNKESIKPETHSFVSSVSDLDLELFMKQLDV